MNDSTVEQLRAKHYTYFSNLMPELINRMLWTREQIDAHQTCALRDMLHHCKTQSPWYAKTLADVNPDQVDGSDLRTLPVTSKPVLMKHWDKVVTVPGASLRGAQEALRAMSDQFYIWDNHVIMASGGTGGQPGVFLYDWAAMATNLGSQSRSIIPVVVRRCGGLDKMRMATIGAEVSTHGSFVMSRIFSNPLQSALRLSAWRTIEDLVPELNAFQPQLLNCYPSCMPSLAQSVRSGALRISPDMIYFNSEHLSEANRQLALETWPNASIFTCWTTSEGAGTFPCPLGDGSFHVSEDLVIIEPVDENGTPVAPGQRSAGIYLTNLFNRAMPIIRYYIDDIFEFEDKPCACGSHYKKVRQVHGRSFERFLYGEISVQPLALELAVIEQPAILEFQIRQTENGVHVLYRSGSSADEARLESRICEALASYGIPSPEVRIEAVSAIERTAAGKLKRFVALPVQQAA